MSPLDWPRPRPAGRGRRNGFTRSDHRKRIRAIAKNWGWLGPDGRRPNASKVVEFLLTHNYTLADAEEGRIPNEVWQTYEL
jgi:hypothetical protein